MTNLPKFRNAKLFQQAFTHRSYLNEVKEKTPSNERLEFLGDSILSFIVSTSLFNRYKEFNEGSLTNLRSLLVNTKTLSKIAQELNFGDLLMLSKGEEESKGRQNPTLLANCFEAYVGALFIDQGIEESSKFINSVLLSKVDEIIQKETLKDPKSILQEIVQAKKQKSPIYKVVEESGPAHDKLFTVGAFVGENMVGKGTGRSKQIAEENAAKVALSKLQS
ncbi:MAG: hypothetical protein ACD_50C00142G0004 [uncultured bacterium]|nr:MAG: hypothetical protein ACD_50C00142G0004 [uncultured bacterium]OGH12981.1 MAG: ribonuclease III [Candidatus Levybacteria bacterium RIFCSPHIGHO2_01_FULL_38_26]